MYIEAVGDRQRTKSARIGRVSLSKTGKTLYYGGRSLEGMGRAWYRDAESGDQYWIQDARADGHDRHGKHKRGSYPIEIDEDVRDEYWPTFAVSRTALTSGSFGARRRDRPVLGQIGAATLFPAVGSPTSDGPWACGRAQLAATRCHSTFVLQGGRDVGGHFRVSGLAS